MVNKLEKIPFNVHEKTIAKWMVHDNDLEEIQCFFEAIDASKLFQIQQTSLVIIIISIIMTMILAVKTTLIYRKLKI